MQITVNGEVRELSKEVSLLEMLSQFDLPNERVAIELNRKVVRRKDWSDIFLCDSDRVEIVHFVGGG